MALAAIARAISTIHRSENLADAERYAVIALILFLLLLLQWTLPIE